ncbi:hypothetical protein, partial [Cognatishimia sp. WU-CL00825]|uniref:hypothetical protein n=1 Tax=Cognatishimia sp. WU-CL00825 TaxID=3127658 RepID=UPI0033653E20
NSFRVQAEIDSRNKLSAAVDIGLLMTETAQNRHLLVPRRRVCCKCCVMRALTSGWASLAPVQNQH